MLKQCRGKSVLYLTLNQGYKTVLNFAKKSDFRRFFVIDCFSLKPGGLNPSIENVVFLPKGWSLGLVGIAINKGFNLLGRRKVLIIDSLNELVESADIEVVAVFLNFLKSNFPDLEIEILAFGRQGKELAKKLDSAINSKSQVGV